MDILFFLLPCALALVCAFALVGFLGERAGYREILSGRYLLSAAVDRLRRFSLAGAVTMLLLDVAACLLVPKIAFGMALVIAAGMAFGYFRRLGLRNILINPGVPLACAAMFCWLVSAGAMSHPALLAIDATMLVAASALAVMARRVSNARWSHWFYEM